MYWLPIGSSVHYLIGSSMCAIGLFGLHVSNINTAHFSGCDVLRKQIAQCQLSFVLLGKVITSFWVDVLSLFSAIIQFDHFVCANIGI